MAAILLDVNFLLALAWTNHEHHDAAKKWFVAYNPQPWATCPLTQCGFVRISTNPKIAGSNVSPSQAAATLQTITAHPSHIFWKDEISIFDALAEFQHIRGHRQITDAYLLALSTYHEGRFATFDQGVPSLANTLQLRNAVLLIPR